MKQGIGACAFLAACTLSGQIADDFQGWLLSLKGKRTMRAHGVLRSNGLSSAPCVPTNRESPLARRVLWLVILFFAAPADGGSLTHAAPMPAYEIYLTGTYPNGGAGPKTTPGVLNLSYRHEDPISGASQSMIGFVSAKLTPATIDLGVGSDELWGTSPSLAYGGGATGALKYYFKVRNPYNVGQIWVPYVFKTSMRVQTRNQSASVGRTEADVSLAIGQYDPIAQRDMWYDESLQRLHTQSYAGATDGNSLSAIVMPIVKYLPGQYGVVRITATGVLYKGGSTNHAGGSFRAFIDPLIYAAPDFFVDVNGQLLPGSEVFPLEFSEGIVQVPEPATWTIVACSMATALLRLRANGRRHRDGSPRCESRYAWRTSCKKKRTAMRHDDCGQGPHALTA